MATTKKRKTPFILTRFINFMKIFKHNRRGILGITILIVSSAVAIAAPLMTPYDPVWETYIARDYAVPVWFRNLPGGENLTENLEVIDQPGFTTPESIEEWNFTKTLATSQATVEWRYNRVWGRGTEKPGCVEIQFRRSKGVGYSGETKVTMAKRFFYPYTGSPGLFKSTVAVLTEGADNFEGIDVNVYFKRLGENTTTYLLWSNRIYSDDPYWTTPFPPIDSYASKEWVRKYFGDPSLDPAKVIFNSSTHYEYGVEIRFQDSKLGTLYKDVEAVVYIDDLSAKLYGTAFGLLGTDHYGRDVFTQLIYGARLSLVVGFLSAVLSVVLGLIVGLVAGYFGGAIDEIVMRFTDMLLVIPGLPLLIVLIAVLRQYAGYSHTLILIFLLGILGWMGFARIVRSQVLSLKERPFVEAAKAVGAGKLRIIGKHILPNVMSFVYVTLALSVPSAILAEAALSWLGLYDPNVMSWGRMLFDVQNNHGVERWWWVLPPGLCIAAVSLSFILIGYALDEILNPRLRIRR